MTTPHPLCPLGTGAEHGRHAFEVYDPEDDSNRIVVTCSGFDDDSDEPYDDGGYSDASRDALADDAAEHHYRQD